MSYFIYVLKIAFAAATLFAAGDGVLGFIDRHRRYHPLERIGLAYVLGVGAVAFSQLYLMALRVPLSGSVVGVLIAACWCVFLVQFARARRSRGAPGRIPCRGQVGSPGTRPCAAAPGTPGQSGILRGSKALGAPDIMVAGFIAWMCFMMFFACLALSMYSWDSRAVWAFIAKVIYHNGTVLTPDYLDPFRYHPAPFYPILMPLAQNVLYHVVGGADEYAVKIIHALFYATYILLFFNALRTHYATSVRAALLGTAVAASVPAFFLVDSGSVPSAYVDFPLGCFFMVTMLYLFQYLRLRRREDGLVSALCAAFCIFTKNEGIALFLIAVGVFCFDIARSGIWKDKRTLGALAVYCAIPIALTVPWFIVRSGIPAHVAYSSPWLRSLVHFWGQAYLIPKIIWLSLKHMYTENSSWGLVWHAITVALLFFPSSMKDLPLRRVYGYMIAVPAVYYIFVITPVYMSLSLSSVTYPVEFEFQGASFERLRMHALPLLLVYTALIIDRVLSVDSARSVSGGFFQHHFKGKRVSAKRAERIEGK